MNCLVCRQHLQLEFLNNNLASLICNCQSVSDSKRISCKFTYKKGNNYPKSVFVYHWLETQKYLAYCWEELNQSWEVVSKKPDLDMGVDVITNGISHTYDSQIYVQLQRYQKLLVFS